MGACCNQGKSRNGRKYSCPATISQKPCFDTFPTSTSEVFFPSSADFIFVFQNNLARRRNPAGIQPIVLREFDFGLRPELCFACSVMHVDVHSGFFAREEVKAEPASAENRRTHSFILHYLHPDTHLIRCPCAVCNCVPHETREGRCGRLGYASGIGA